MATTGSEQSKTQQQIEERITDVVRGLARELAGDRAASAVSPTASFERDVGLDSLARVELLTRLESALGRELDDRFLVLDSAREIARALPSAPMLRRDRAPRAERATPAQPLRLDDVTNLVDALQRRATIEPTRVHVLLNADHETQKVTYAELWDGAARIARSLRVHGIQRGEPVAIMLPTSLDYLQSFMGVLAAGAIAVPLYPPARLDRIVEYLQRQARILANANSRLMIAMPEAVPIARMLRRQASALETIVTAQALKDGAEPLNDIAGEPDDPALIQYTSGSTGDPKGVLLTHANLLENIRAIAAGIQLTPTDACVSWLPLYHDMGLIGTWLNAMVNGIPLTLMSPLSFLARPERWLWAIHEQGATVSAAPNFAYELCVRKIGDAALAGLDLSSWRCASNGSEPVSAATLDRFAERFAPFGFKREALFPVYGLAESSVALCFPPVGRAPVVDVVQRQPFEREGRAITASSRESLLTFVSVGTPLPRHEVRIVDDARRDVPERVVGRLLFRGPSCTSGYYRNPEATKRLILADGWLDSGDLAYFANGELFITGRMKDLIIKGGRNLVPQEIEEVAGSVEGIRKGCVAAFGVADEGTGTERLVVIAEARALDRPTRERLEHNVVAAIAEGVGIPPDTVLIAAPGTVPKTPSGKVRRSAARDVFESGRVASAPKASLDFRARLVGSRLLDATQRAARAFARSLQLAYLLTVWLLALGLLGPIIVILMVALPSGKPVRVLSRAVARIALFISGCPVVVEGREHVPQEGAVILVANHTSYVDTPVLVAAIARDFEFVAMTEILTWPVIGLLARRGRHLTVDRWHMRQSVADVAAIERHLRAGKGVLFFAEGGFSRARGLRPFRLGAFEAAVATGAPVIPIALSGAREILPADAHRPHPRRVHVWIGEPL
ncbi:MAG TPA: AMP-binding protein, partial [Gemmatimonadaceae bacterium]